MTSEDVIEENNQEDMELAEAVAAFDNDEDSEYASDDSLEEETMDEEATDEESDAYLADSADDESLDEDEELPFLGEADDIDEEDGASV